MKNEQHLLQSSPSLNQFITYFKLQRLILLSFILCTFVGASLAILLALYLKEFIIFIPVSSNSTAYYDLQRFTPPLITTLPPPPHPVSHAYYDRKRYTPPPPMPQPYLVVHGNNNLQHQTPPLLPPPPPPPPHTVLHLNPNQVPIERMEDGELMEKAAIQPGTNSTSNVIIPKVAFLFLTKEDLGLRLLWEKFFQGHEGLFSIYVHYSPTYNGSVPENSVFHGRNITSKEVGWGLFNMVESERRLLANALLDTSNERFVLLSESTIPLYNFSTIYNYLINSRKSFVEVYDLPNAAGRGRYNHHMRPTVTIEKWRKGSQWFEMNRNLALLVVSDQVYYPVFAKYCHRYCYADEHYLPTFVHIMASDKNSDRTLTWADWSRHRPHPSSFNAKRVTENFLNSIRNGAKCEYNGEQTEMCYLFARKFTPDSLDKLLSLAPKVQGFNT